MTPTQSIKIPAPSHDSRIPSGTTDTTEVIVEKKQLELTPSISGPTSGSISSQLHGRIYPALLLSLAMTTRGEIGFLIAAVAESSGLLLPEDVYLIVQWGIVLCTLGGPIGVGLVVRRIRQGKAVLGGWGETELV